MTNNFDPAQFRNHPKNKGSWSANQNGEPEVPLAVRTRLAPERAQALREFGVLERTSVLTAFKDARDREVQDWAAMMNHNSHFQNWAQDWGTVASFHLEGISPAVALDYSTSGVDSVTVEMLHDKFTPADAREFSETSGLSKRRVGDWITHNDAHARHPKLQVSAQLAGEYGEEFMPDEVAVYIRDNVTPTEARATRANAVMVRDGYGVRYE